MRDRTDAADQDLGIALVELLAHVADALSAYQDRIAAEARLTTLRRGLLVIAALGVICFSRRRD